MKNAISHPEEESIVVYGSFEENGYAPAEQVTDKDAGPEETYGDDTGHVPDDIDIYIGKPLHFLYNIFLPVFNVTAALLLL